MDRAFRGKGVVAWKNIIVGCRPASDRVDQDNSRQHVLLVLYG